MSENVIWPLVRETCPLPLLEHWQRPVLDLLMEQQMLVPLPAALGPVKAWRLNLKLDLLEAALGDLIRNGILTTSAQRA
ncbi:hypothetical protein ACQKIK_21495 [Pseudomonas sp. NPDC047961]|jgi:hypothetical protein